ncbi:conserved membrane hypothetical protein [uncultured Eubacteriales bacterium]|uniref:ABC-2 family transporter protein n=1 Tax=uncultured Eubacteriales bacterium TaxID=172733 RepID=A0A212IY75_9FIRM|nr:conserved membrane hypothetical protein [uncultured Eubacteriales bacterium]
MMGFVYKDFLVLRRQILLYLLFVGVYAALVISGVFGPYILPALLVVIGLMLPMSSMSYDDLARWDKYAAATPFGRQGIVAGKYLFALLCILGSAVLVLILMLALSLTGLMEASAAETCLTVLGCIGSALTLDAILLPLLFKFGTEKSRVILMILFAAVFGGSAVVGSLTEKFSPLPAPPSWLLASLPVTLALIAVGGFVVSYFVSQAIFAKKEL